jgi:hypothetical protein
MGAPSISQFHREMGGKAAHSSKESSYSPFPKGLRDQ